MSRLRLRRRRNDDGGQALVLVVLVSAMVMVIAGTSVSITAANIKPSRLTADTQAAFAAAQGGVDEFAVALAACGVDYLIGDCPAIYSKSVKTMIGADGVATRAKYAWNLIMTPDSHDTDVIRVEVTGTVNNVSRKVVADYRSTPSFLDYLYFTEEETSSPAVVLRYYGPRTVALPTAAFRAEADKISSSRTSVTWSGAQNEEACSQRWYDSEFSPGRWSLRETLHGGQATDYTETTNSPVVTRSGNCDVTFSSGMTFSGKVYSKDAFLFNRNGGAGPMFLEPIRTEWSPSKNPKSVAPNYYRGDAPASGSEKPRVAAGKMSMPPGIADLELNATCVFTGPTRIKLEGTSAVVTSPQTNPAALKVGCTPTGTPSTLVGSGLVQVRFAITNTTSFYVKSTAPVAAASATNPLFDLRDIQIPTLGVQPLLFFTEMNTATQPINLTTLRATAASGPHTTPTHTTLNPWLAQANARKLSGLPVAQYQAVSSPAAVPGSGDPLLERAAMTTTIQRRMCTLSAAKVCLATPAPTAWATAFHMSRATYTFPITSDITPYQTGLATTFVEGTLKGKLTIASASGLVLSGDTEYVVEAGKDVGTLGLVADANVEIYHPVSCATVAPVTPPGGTCPDDITGLYSGGLAGSFDTYHPSRRYLNMRPDLVDNKTDAAILARQGSFTTQNYLRGTPMGTNTVTGGVYQAHRGPNGVNWNSTERSGYLTSMYYDPRLGKNPPPNFVEPQEALTDSAWMLLGVSGEQG